MPEQKQAQAKVSPPANVQTMLRGLLAAAMKKLYASKDGAQAIVRGVEKAQDPALGIVAATGLVFDQIAEVAKGVPPQILERIQMPIAVMIAQMCIAAGVIKDDPKLLSRIAQLMQRARSAAAKQPAPQQQAQPPAPQQPRGLVGQAMGA